MCKHCNEVLNESTKTAFQDLVIILRKAQGKLATIYDFCVPFYLLLLVSRLSVQSVLF
jgi:hypothetical protein